MCSSRTIRWPEDVNGDQEASNGDLTWTPLFHIMATLGLTGPTFRRPRLFHPEARGVRAERNLRGAPRPRRGRCTSTPDACQKPRRKRSVRTARSPGYSGCVAESAGRDSTAAGGGSGRRRRSGSRRSCRAYPTDARIETRRGFAHPADATTLRGQIRAVGNDWLSTTQMRADSSPRACPGSKSAT